MPIYEINSRRPRVGENTWISPAARIIGDVTIGRDCWIGPGAVIRGDLGSIVIGDETAVEDGVIIHCAEKTIIGDRVTLGHMAMIHNTTIEEYAVIGMNSTVSDHSVVGAWSIIAEHSLVKKNQVIPGGEIWGGNPALLIAKLTDRHRQRMVWGKQVYVDLVAQYNSTFRQVDPEE